MDFDGLSSPPAMRSSLPPSSAPDLSLANGTGSPRRPTVDALTLGDDEADEEEQDGTGSRKRRRQRGQVNGDVPRVKDAVGESVAESFETFLKTCASRSFLAIHL
jgi:DNA replication licensing factor MCM6